MGKLIKWLLGLVAVIVVLIVAAVILLPMIVDPNDYKDEIVQVVKDKTGRDLQIEQDLNLSVFPWVGVETGGVSLSNAKGFGDQPFAQINELGLRVKLLPLLSKQVEVDTLVLNGLNLNLMRNKEGVSNWDDLAGEGKDHPSHVEHDSRERGLAAFKVEGVQVQDANIAWTDEQAGQKYELKGVRLVTGTLSPGTDVPVEAGLSLSSSAPKLDLLVDLQAKINANEAFDRYVISGLQLNLDGKGEGLPKDGMQVKAGADIDMNLADGLLKVSALKLDGPEVSLSGDVSVGDLKATPQVNGDLKLAQTNLKKLAALFGTQIETTDAKALTQVSADIKLQQQGKVLKIDPLTVKLDDSTAKGYFHVLNPEGPVLRGKIDIDQLNVDRYLPPASEGESTAKAEGQKAQAGNPFEPLRKLDLEAEAGIGKLTVNKLNMQQVHLKVVNKKGVLTAKPMGAKLYGGEFKGATVLNAAGKTPKIHAKKDLTGINIGPLLKDLTGQDRLLGKGEVHLDVRTVGLSEKEINRTLSGNASLKFTDGAYKGVNLADLIRGAGGLLGGGGASTTAATGEDARTDFSSLSASAMIKNGLITNKDLDAKSPLLRVSGNGTADLKSSSMNYLLTTELVASLEGQGGKGADKLSGVPIPVRIKGPFSDLSYTPDLEGVLKAQAEKKLESKKEEIKAKAAEKLQDKLKGKLNLPGLFR